MVYSALVISLLPINYFLSLFNFALDSLSQMSVQDSKALKQRTAVCSLQGYVYYQELHQMFSFPSREQVLQYTSRRFKKHFPNMRVIVDCYEIEC